MDRDYVAEFETALWFAAAPWAQMPSLNPPPPPETHDRDLNVATGRKMQEERANATP